MKKIVSGTLAALAFGGICTAANIASVEAAPSITSFHGVQAIQSSMTPLSTQALWQVIDGIEYYYGNTNYPIWDSGTGAFSVADLSSAVVTDDTEKTCTAAVIIFSVTYRNGMATTYDPPIVSENHTMYIRVDKKSGTISLKPDYRAEYFTFSFIPATHRRALQLIIDTARQHSN